MSLFVSTLNQMGVIGFYMIIGFAIAKLGIVDRKSTTLLSKLENNVFLPALVLYTFIENFNVASLSESWKLLLFSLGTEIAVILFPLFTWHFIRIYPNHRRITRLLIKEDVFRK